MSDKRIRILSIQNLKRINTKELWKDLKEAIAGTERDFTETSLGKAIFSSEIGKARQKLGLLRLILPQFLKKINVLIKKATELQSYNILDIKKLQGDLIIK